MISNTLVSFQRLGALALVGWLTVAGSLAWGQIEDPVTWDVGLYPSEEAGLHDLVVHASVDACWHIYSQDNDPNEGPVRPCLNGTCLQAFKPWATWKSAPPSKSTTPTS